MRVTPGRIQPRLTPLDIVLRAEAREEAWASWAMFWITIGVLLGVAAAVTLMVFSGR